MLPGYRVEAAAAVTAQPDRALRWGSRRGRSDAMSEQPKRIQRKRSKGWRMPPGTVYVGRPTKWGNPFRLTDYGVAGAGGTPVKPPAHARALAARDFRAWLETTPDGAAVAERARRELRSKDLACFCPLSEPCHADVLLEIANRISTPLKRSRGSR